PAIKDGKVNVTLPTYKKGDKVATRKAYGDALKALAARPTVVAMDGEVGNSTFAEEFAKAYPQRYFEMFIAEQQMVAAAVGMSVRHRVPFASTFAAFLTRAYDFIRMAAVSRASIRVCGSHAGISIGEDGPSQMGLEEAGVSVRVLDAYSVTPIDSAAIRTAVQATHGNALVVEDHWPEGGLADAVLEALDGERPYPARIVRLAVTHMPGSGTPREL